MRKIFKLIMLLIAISPAASDARILAPKVLTVLVPQGGGSATPVCSGNLYTKELAILNASVADADVVVGQSDVWSTGAGIALPGGVVGGSGVSFSPNPKIEDLYNLCKFYLYGTGVTAGNRTVNVFYIGQEE